MSRKQRLELTWIGKDDRPRLEPRILLEDTEKSFHAPYRVTEQDIFDNRLIFGDNLLALKALEQEFTGKVKCIFIDPPYNTGSAFEHYDDGVEHSIWLGLMRDRLEILRNLLAEDGSIWITIDDNEAHYLKVMCDEIFGRSNFINQVSMKMKQSAGASGGGEDKRLKKNIEYALVYTKNMEIFTRFNEVLEEQDLFDLIEEMRDSGKSWKYTRILKSLGTREFKKEITDGSGNPIKIYSHFDVEMVSISEVIQNEKLSEQEAYLKYFSNIFRDTNSQSSIRTRVIENAQSLGDFISIDYIPLSGRSKGTLTTVYYKGEKRDQIAWLKDVAYKKGNKLLKLEKIGTYWDGFPLNNLTKEGGVKFPNGKKPEALLKRILELATNQGDLVLDSFAGSGTTGAVAHKMGRRWIMIELGEHCHTHIIPRLQKVINNEDPGGITKSVNWQGGGGFRYYKLAPSLLEKDKYDNWVISQKYNPAMLAEAMCKLMGFTYAPSQTQYWNQGYSSESDHIYVTTNHLNYDQLNAINEELRDDQTLLICCKAFRANPDDFSKITIKKIPQSVLHQCEWGHDDYSLNVANLKTLEKPPQPLQSQQLSLLETLQEGNLNHEQRN